MLADEAVTRTPTLGTVPEGTRPRRVAFEKERGVTFVSCGGSYAYVLVSLSPDAPRAAQELEVYRRIADLGFSINLVKLHRQSVSFAVDEPHTAAVTDALGRAGFDCRVTPSVTILTVYAAEMRHTPGVLGRIAAALAEAGIALVQTADGPDTVYCLVERPQAEAAATALRQAFGIGGERRRIVVQKFGGQSVGTEAARRQAAERVLAARRAGEWPVVVVSAIGRMGEPYATDTLLANLEGVDPAVEPPARERDLLMACGEIISTVIMAQTLKAMGLKAVALTGGQAGIRTDTQFGDAQIADIDPAPILKLIDAGETDAVVVAGFQGSTDPDGALQGDITTLGRGGSDTTASALGVALKAERVEIYTHVDGVMTADPEVVPEAKTLPLVTYEEVAEMAVQGAKVLHPRAAEIAMTHQVPLWVKSSFSDAPGTRVAALAEIQPPTARPVTGIATQGNLAYFTLRPVEPEARMATARQAFGALAEAGIPQSFTSLGPRSMSFVVENGRAEEAARRLEALRLPFEQEADCALVSVVSLRSWEVPGFLHSIARALYEREIPVLQMADSVGSVSCLVRGEDGGPAVRALHEAFALAA